MTLNLLLFLRNRDHLYIGAIVNKSTAAKLQAITHKAAVRIMSAWTMWMEGATANMVGRKDAQGESQDFTCGCPEFHLKDGRGRREHAWYMFRVQIWFAFSISWVFGPSKCLNPCEILSKHW